MSDHNRKGDDLIIELSADLRNFIERYDREQRQEKEERETFRNDITADVKDLADKIAPVLRDHEVIVRGGKWVIAGIVSLWGIVKGWFFLKDHLKP